MKIAFDTSVLVAAAVGSHPRHKEAATQLEFAREETHAEFLCSHATAEIYSVLTKLPLVQRISPAEVFSVHLVAAESVQADVLLTFNVRDFERIQEANSPRIAE